MSSEPNDFEALRKLMALKRHEQPPPEYLNQLSHRIIGRIEGGEGRLNFWDKVSAHVALRPGVAYAFGLTICGALGLSAAYMVRQEMTQTADASEGLAIKIPVVATTAASQMNSANPPVLHVANWLGNTNPADSQAQADISLFTPRHAAIAVSYESGN